MEYKCIFKNEMASFLERYKSMGCDIRCYVTIFNKLDMLLVSLNLKEKRITKEIAEQFASAFTVRNYTFHNYMSHYNVFTRYLNSIGIYAYELELPKLKSDYTPYIFDDNEWHRIIDAADNLTIVRCPLYSIQMPVFIRILYGCGTRVTETLRIKVEDINLEDGLIILRETKNKKERIIPIDITLTEILKKYISVCKLKPSNFLFRSQRKYDYWNIYSVENCFEHILKKADIVFTREKRNDSGPTLHCLRHTFVLNSLKKSNNVGHAFEEMIPFLSAYLGHASLHETDKYLKFSYELYDDAVSLIENYTSDLFPEVNSYA